MFVRCYCQGGIGESARTFAERFKEHQKAPSPIYDHCNTSGHEININNFIIVGREDQNLTRAIKEALFLRVSDPFLNRNIGKYHLPHIWDEVLHKTSELRLKHWPSGHSICHPGYNICQTTPMLGFPIRHLGNNICQTWTITHSGNNTSHLATASAKHNFELVAIISAIGQ